MFLTLMSVLEAALQLWNSHEKNKYIDHLAQLKKDYYEQINKSFDQRDNAVLDNLEFQLRLAADSFAASVGKPAA